MANDKIGIDEPSAIDKYLDTESLVVGADTVHRERTQIAGAAATEIARVTNADPNSGDFALAVRAIPSATATPISAAALPLPAGAATGAKQDIGNVSLASIDGKVLTDAQLRASAVSVSGPLTDAQLRAAAVPVSAAALPLPAGASTEATLAAIKAKTDNLDVALSTRTKAADVQNVTGPLTDAQLRAVAVPVSGPLTDVQLRASAVPVSAAALPLPAGAATDAGLVALLTELQQKPEADVRGLYGDAGYVEGDLAKNLTQTPDGRLRTRDSAIGRYNPLLGDQSVLDMLADLQDAIRKSSDDLGDTLDRGFSQVTDVFVNRQAPRKGLALRARRVWTPLQATHAPSSYTTLLHR